jgi:hypothetical protein
MNIELTLKSDFEKTVDETNSRGFKSQKLP